MGNSCQRQQRQPNHDHEQYYRRPEVKRKSNRAQIPPPPNTHLQDKNVRKVQPAQPISIQPSYFGINNHEKQLPVQSFPEELEYYEQPIEVPANKKCRLIENYGNPCNHYDCPYSNSYYPPPRKSNTRIRQYQRGSSFIPYSGPGFSLYDQPFQ